MPSLELAIPLVRQSTCYTCGPAALLAALRYLGVAGRATEKSLAREMRCLSKEGTSFDAMVAAAEKRWPLVQLLRFMTRERLREHVKRGDVAILCVQAWAEDRPPVGGYGPRVGDGHYVVATHVGAKRATFMDPSNHVRSTLTTPELQERWHEVDLNAVVPGCAIVLRGTAEPRRKRLGRSAPMG